jgi:hypothetical protein
VRLGTPARFETCVSAPVREVLEGSGYSARRFTDRKGRGGNSRLETVKTAIQVTK